MEPQDSTHSVHSQARNPIAPPPREELAALYLKYSTREIAPLYDVSLWTVRKWFLDYGIPRDRRGGRKQQITPPPKEELAALYPEKSLQQIADIYSVVHGTVRNWLHAYQIPMARVGGRVGVSTLKRPDVQTDSIVALTKQGLTVEQIAKKLRISPGLVFYRQRLARLEAAKKRVEKFKGGWNKKTKEREVLRELVVAHRTADLKPDWEGIASEWHRRTGETRSKDSLRKLHERQ